MCVEWYFFLPNSPKTHMSQQAAILQNIVNLLVPRVRLPLSTTNFDKSINFLKFYFFFKIIVDK
jgi:hypothetical protein